MIPGEATHVIQKISSTTSTVDAIFDSFHITSLKAHKVFLIKEMQALFSPSVTGILGANRDQSPLTNVIIEVGSTQQNEPNFFIGFMYKGSFFLNHQHHMPYPQKAFPPSYLVPPINNSCHQHYMQLQEKFKPTPSQESIEKI
jgi:hypothetical protein